MKKQKGNMIDLLDTIYEKSSQYAMQAEDCYNREDEFYYRGQMDIIDELKRYLINKVQYK